MKKIILPQVLAGVLVVLSGAQAATEVARVNEKVITLEDVNTKLVEAARGNPMAAPSKKQILDDLIKREAAVQEAKKLKLDQDPIVMERMNNVLYFALLEKKLGADFEKINLSDAEAKNWYEKNPEMRTSHIFIALPNNVSDDEASRTEKHLGEILSEIKSGKHSFAEAAQRYSEDPSATLGGDLDYRMKDRLDPTYFKAAQKLGKVGDIAGPVRTPFGLHLIRLTGKHTWLEVDRARVKRLILEEKRQDLVSRFLNDLRQRSKVSTNEKALKE
jgi:peptidyl-prolyl cis-trans isomerase C/peptidyl-prolyl cis-trans isomerase D